MAEAPPRSTEDAVFRIVVKADIQRVWRELTKTGEAQGAVFDAWLHTTGLAPGAPLQLRAGSGAMCWSKAASSRSSRRTASSTHTASHSTTTRCARSARS